MSLVNVAAPPSPEPESQVPEGHTQVSNVHDGLKGRATLLDVHKDPKTKDLEGWKATARKTGIYALAFIPTIIFLIFSFVVNVVFHPIKLISFARFSDFTDTISRHKASVMQLALKTDEARKIKTAEKDKLVDETLSAYPTKKPERAEVEGFIKQVQGLLCYVEIMNPDEIEPNYSVDILRSKIHEVMKTDVYKALKNENVPAIDFIQILIMHLKGGNVEGSDDVYTKYGQNLLGDLDQEEFNFDQLATLMDKEADAIFAFKRNTWYQKLFWGLFHPFHTLHALTATWFPIKFKSHKENPEIFGFDYVLPESNGKELPYNANEKRMRFYYGPGPTGDKLYNDGYLVYMEKQQKRLKRPMFERRNNYQSIHLRSESKRICEMKRWEAEHPESHRFLSMSFDTPFTKKPPEFTNAADFMGKLQEQYCGEIEGAKAYRAMYKEKKAENGIYVGQNILSNAQVEGAVKSSKSIFTELSKDNKYWEKLAKRGKAGKVRLARMMTLGTRGMISLGSLYKGLQDSPDFDARLNANLTMCRASGACKQDIDRAIDDNIVERLFFRLLTNDKPLTKKEVYSIVGAVIGRAFGVEGRLLLWHRYEILSDLLHFVGSQERMKVLSGHLKGYIKENFSGNQ